MKASNESFVVKICQISLFKKMLDKYFGLNSQKPAKTYVVTTQYWEG